MHKSKYLLNTFFILFIFLLANSNTFAQPFSVQTSTGFIYLPFNDWSKIFGGNRGLYYFKNNPNLINGLSIHYSLNSKSSISIGTELINASASLSGSGGTIDWKFQGIPITIGYEYEIFTFNKRFELFLGAGGSYFISKVTGHESYFNTTGERNGNGYGVQASFGLKSELTRKLSMITQIRYRYSNGMAFTENKGDVKVEFTGFDFSTGLSWSF